MNILIVGGTGFLGTHFCEQLSVGNKVTVISKYRNKFRNEITARFLFLKWYVIILIHKIWHITSRRPTLRRLLWSLLRLSRSSPLLLRLLYLGDC